MTTKFLTITFAYIPNFIVMEFPRKKPHFSGRAKGAAKGSCGETVVKKGVFGESRFFSAPLGFSGPFRCFKSKP